MKRVIGITCLLAFVCVPAFAQDNVPAAGEAMGNGATGGVVYKKTELDFERDDVKGVLVKPDEERIGVRYPRKTSSLIRVRRDFIPEMLKSVEDI